MEVEITQLQPSAWARIPQSIHQIYRISSMARNVSTSTHLALTRSVATPLYQLYLAFEYHHSRDEEQRGKTRTDMLVLQNNLKQR